MSQYSIKQYQAEVEKIIHYGGTKKETAIRTAFFTLLNEYAKQKGLMIVAEVTIKTKAGRNVTPDGTLKDTLRQDWGYWESKDESDKIEDEIKKKFDKGYPRDNILFEDSQTAILYQNEIEVMRVAMSDAVALHQLLTTFISYERPEVQTFRAAIELFKQDIPKVTETIRGIIIEAEATNTQYIHATAIFLKLCQDSINPDVNTEDVREMIIQHILTEDVFNTIFDENQFHRENNIARELETVIHTFFTGAIRKTALANVQHYYQAINAAAAGIADHHEKQKFLKVIYETFYKSYNPKAADRLGVVYTPNEIVQFMIESTDYLLHRHFGKFMEDKGVEILDPATGTGTFICDIIDYIRRDKLEYKYKHEIHANEVAILPYYISNLNIEYTYTQKMGAYSEFQNLCFVDTLDNMGFGYRGKQTDMFAPFTEENTKRIKNQNDKKIAVIIGNPPYNAKQENYNNQNANRLYANIDKRIKDTFIKYGTAQNQIVVYDMYTRFYRWAFDRLDENGIVAFITNRSFIDSRTFDGFRHTIQSEFDHAYIIDTRSDVRANPKIAGTTHNVFGIQTGVAIMLLVKKQGSDKKQCVIQYVSLDDYWVKEQKLQWFSQNPIKDIPFEHIQPDKKNNWINLSDNDFDDLLPLIDKSVKAGKAGNAVFKMFSSGLKTQRDEWVYDFSEKDLAKRMEFFTDVYAQTLANPDNPKKFEIKWDRELTNYRNRGIVKAFEMKSIIPSLYRPYTKKHFYFDKHFNGMTYQWFEIFRKDISNRYITIPGIGFNKEYQTLCSDKIVCLDCLEKSQNIPQYIYDGDNQIDNITDWGLKQFITQYGKKGMTKEAIFHYVYAVLHHPAYRTKYELNLKREFPRIPFYTDFAQWAAWGQALMHLHIDYETVTPYGLKPVTTDTKDSPKAKLKADKIAGTIAIDDNTTLTGVPPQAWDYKLGNRSAIEWILDQYKEKKPTDPTIAEQFNTYRFADYKETVIDLIQRVCTVSVETMQIVHAMPV